MASPLLIPVLLIVVGLPVAWLVCEFKAKPGVRRLLGVRGIRARLAWLRHIPWHHGQASIRQSLRTLRGSIGDCWRKRLRSMWQHAATE